MVVDVGDGLRDTLSCPPGELELMNSEPHMECRHAVIAGVKLHRVEKRHQALALMLSQGVFKVESALVATVSQLHSLIHSCGCAGGDSSPEPALVRIEVSLYCGVPPGVDDCTSNDFGDDAWCGCAQSLGLGIEKF